MTAFQEVRLGDLIPADVTITRGFPTQRAESEGDLRVMSIAALRNEASPKFFASREDLADLGIEVARPGDVLVAIEGGTIGEALVVPDGLDDFVPSQQVATLRVNPHRLDPWYLGAWLRTEAAVEQLRRLARGAGIQRIPIKELSSLVIRLLPLADQRAISERFLAFEAAIRSHLAVSACLEEVRDLDLVISFADEAAESGPRRTGKSGSDVGP